MKAVIMAGGEGTRLRPQTSNLPKPMLPLVGRPMMEHIVSLLRRHGVTDIVVTVAFMPNAIRNYFGDGSELGVRMVYATEETPLGHGRLGAQRPRGADRALPGHLGRRADRHRPDLGGASSTTRATRWPRWRCARSTTRWSSASSSPTRTGASSGSWRSRAGGRCSATPSTPGSTCSSPRSSTSSPRAAPSTSPARCSRPPSMRASPSSATSPTATGRTSGTTAAYLKAHRDILDSKVEVDMTGFELRPGVWLGKGSSVDPSAPDRRAGLHRGELHHRSGRRARGLLDPRGQRPHVRAGRGPAFGDRGERLPGAVGPGRGGGAGPGLRPAPRGPLRAGVGGGGGLPDRGQRRRCGATSRSTPTRWSRPGPR